MVIIIDCHSAELIHLMFSKYVFFSVQSLVDSGIEVSSNLPIFMWWIASIFCLKFLVIVRLDFCGFVSRGGVCCDVVVFHVSIQFDGHISARNGCDVCDGVHEWLPDHETYSTMLLDVKSFCYRSGLSFASLLFVGINKFDVDAGAGEPVVVFCFEFSVCVNLGFL